MHFGFLKRRNGKAKKQHRGWVKKLPPEIKRRVEEKS